MMLRSAVCFFAHPDDEMLVAGMIAMMTRQKIAVHVVCATRGEGGELGEPPLTDRRGLGAVREEELRCAAQALGASLTVLDYVDPTVGPDDVLYPFDADLDTLARQFVEITRRQQATLVLTHGSDGEYGHPAHQLIHRAVMRGIPGALPSTLIYSVAASVPNIEDLLWNKSEAAHLALDIRPWGDAKLSAMECHRTQHALFMRHRKSQNVEDTLRAVESVRRQWPPVREGEAPQDDFAVLLRTVGAWQPEAGI